MSLRYVNLLDSYLDRAITRNELRSALFDINWKLRQIAYDEKYLTYPYPIFYYGRRYRDAIKRLHWSALKAASPDVLDYPRFTKRLIDTDIRSGHSAYMEVVVSGAPDVEVKWYRNGIPLIETSNVYVTHYRPDCWVLTVRDALPSDTGLYSCIASNLAGTIRTAAYVHVQDSPIFKYTPLRLNFYDKLYDLV